MKIVLLFCLVFLSCAPKPFVIKSIPVKETVIPESKIDSPYSELQKEKLKNLYIQAKKPSFAFIKGFYKLPKAKPYGASLVVKSFGPMGELSIKKTDDKEADFVITPIEGTDALAMSKAINHLLDASVNLKEISLTDALSIAKEEKRSFGHKKVVNIKKTLPPNVDYLVSLDEISTKEGLQYFGRIIKSDGKLVAFNNSNSLESLIVSLIEEGLTRIKDGK